MDATAARDRNGHSVGGTVMTNFISDTTSLGTATGDLCGAVSATVLNQVVEGEIVVFNVQHHWVTQAGDTIYMDPAAAKTRLLEAHRYAILSYSANITGGTGRFDRASGHLDFIGELDGAVGHTVFRYRGEVCFAASSK